MSKFVSDENLRQFKTNLDDVYASKAEYQTNIYKTTYTFQKRVNSGGTLQDAQISPNPQNIKAGDLVYDGNGTIASFEHDYQTNSNLAYVLYISNVKVQIFKTTTTLSKTYNFSNAVDFNTLQPDNGNGIKVGDIIVDKFGTIAIVGAIDIYVDAPTRISNDYYTKPADGIPKSDLAQDVQASLGKADTALQSAPVTSVAGKTGAVTLAKGDVGLSNVDNVQQYSASNPPPYPVSSVNGQTGAVNLTTADAEVLSGLAFDEGFGQTSGNIVGYRIGKLVVVTVIFTPGSSGIAWRDWALATGLPLPRVEGNLNPNPEYVGVCIPDTPCELAADGITDVQFNLRMYEGSSRLWIHRCTTTNGAAVGAGVKFRGTIAYVCQ